MISIDFNRARRFLADDALPFWSDTGFYDNGCFVEHLDLSGTPVDPGFTRTRVQARQIYVFCHAHLAGIFPANEMCERAAGFFMRSAWLGPERGWAKLIDREGGVKDGSYDFYDVSFALFAIGWYYRLSGDPRCLELAHATLDFLERHAGHPAGGFRNNESASLPRQQNPHMHLVEALNVWFEATGEARFGDLAERVLVLFETRFTDPASGALFEFFNDDWSRFDGPMGRIVEPGHQFEWAWIIGHNGRMTGKTRYPLMQRLIASATRAGYNPQTGLTIDQVDGEGQVLAGSTRLWPQTESIKAALAEREFLGGETNSRISLALSGLFDRFLDPAPVSGTWIDHYDDQWSPIVDKVPASSLYHITLAFLDLLRLEPMLSGQGVG
jgi:mannose/cellobiose epimerase-like protein (N-acyl-D-glucosamine 2-epimerase family)